MHNQQYVTITHYKEREFYFLNYAIQTKDGFIAKDIEQFHETEKEKFIERIRQLQVEYPKNQVISLSLSSNQVVKDKEDPNKVSAQIFKDNFVTQNSIDLGNIPVTLYFSPYAVLYEEYKHKLDDKLTLMIGLFDRKLYILFANKEKIHQSWTLGTRGLTEKQIADRVYKSMKAYYKISYKFADHIEMLVSDDSPKLLKVLREELSMSILPTQKTIHNILHHMGADQSRFSSSYIKPYLSSSKTDGLAVNEENPKVNERASLEEVALNSLDDIRLNSPSSSVDTNQKAASFFDGFKSSNGNKSVSLVSFIPLLFVLGLGGYFSLSNAKIQDKMNLLSAQSYAQTNNALLSLTSKDIFSSMGKSAELKSANISNEKIELKGVVWGIEPLRNALTELYSDGEFVIKPLENFMTEFSFKSKI